MMGSIVFLVGRARHPSRVTGRHVHAWLLTTIGRFAPAFASGLHQEFRHKPFTVSNLVQEPDGPAWFRVTSLSAPLTRILTELVDEDLGPVQLGAERLPLLDVIPVRSRHPFAGIESFDELFDCRDVPRKLRLVFLSPTCFGSNGGSSLYPRAELVFRGLALKLDRYRPGCLEKQTTERLLHATLTDSYRLETQTLTLGRRIFKGFVGEACYLAPAGLAPWLWRLARFAFYAGVGRKTTMGMGQCLALLGVDRDNSSGIHDMEPVSDLCAAYH